jgi:NTE family protein
MADVHNRVNEIAFNIALVREISAIQHMAAAVDEQDGTHLHQGAVRLHLISGTEALRDMSVSSKFNTDWNFIRQLHDLGHAAADRWLRERFDEVGVVSTLDLAHVYSPETLAGTPG